MSINNQGYFFYIWNCLSVYLYYLYKNAKIWFPLPALDFCLCIQKGNIYNLTRFLLLRNFHRNIIFIFQSFFLQKFWITLFSLGCFFLKIIHICKKQHSKTTLAQIRYYTFLLKIDILFTILFFLQQIIVVFICICCFLQNSDVTLPPPSNRGRWILNQL